jgi:hypothetical protein
MTSGDAVAGNPARRTGVARSRGFPKREEDVMVRRIALIVAAGALAAAGGAGAGTESHSVDVTLTTPTVVGGQRIPAGDYRLAWAGESSPVHVSIEKGSKVVATVDAKVEPREPSPDEELISRSMKDGSRALEEVRLAHHKTALVFPIS